MLQLRVEHIKWETPDAATFQLQELTGKGVHYRAGQFITLVFEHHHQELRRSYSISSSPDDGLLSITVKRVTNGELSRFLLSHTKVGDVWQAAEPAGRFVIDEQHLEQHLFFFAAGSGIVPIFSQIKSLLRQHPETKLTLTYSNRNSASALFLKDLQTLKLQYGHRFNLINLYSDEGKRLNNVVIEQLLRAQPQATIGQSGYYLCGPFDYMRMIRLTLLYLGISPVHIRKENFVIETVPVLEQHTLYAPRKIKINYKGETYDIQTGENQSILQAALQNKIRLPYSCRAGICSACAARCTSGKVDTSYNEVLTTADIANGWILTCTGYALGDDVVIEL